MKVNELLVEGKKKVHSDFAKMILADMLNINSLELFNYVDREVDQEFIDNYFKKIDLISDKKPVQYVIGNVNFYGLTLKVNENVLIPRFETEELVSNTLEFIKKHFNRDNLDIIDLGCGSGAIGLTLKSKLENSNIDLVDISLDALNVAKENASNLNLDVNFINNDMLNGITKKYDVIISNPPYIRENEVIQDIVRDNEPHLALYGGKDGLKFYRQILESCKNNLKDDFLIAFEIGYDQRKDIEDIAIQNLDNIDLVCFTDLSNRDRMIFIMNKK